MNEAKTLYPVDEAAREAGVSYGRLLALLRKYPDRIPCERQGRRLFFPPRAIEIVRDIARESKARQGRHLRRKTREKAASDMAEVLIEKAMMSLEEASANLESALITLRNGRGSVVLSVQTLIPNTFRFRRPTDILIEYDGPAFVARLIEVNLSASGNSRQEAVNMLRVIIVETYRALIGTEREHWTEELRTRSILLELVRSFG
jgi:hypothetical protein